MAVRDYRQAWAASLLGESQKNKKAEDEYRAWIAAREGNIVDPAISGAGLGYMFSGGQPGGALIGAGIGATAGLLAGGSNPDPRRLIPSFSSLAPAAQMALTTDYIRRREDTQPGTGMATQAPYGDGGSYQNQYPTPSWGYWPGDGEV